MKQPHKAELCHQRDLFQAGPFGMLGDFAGALSCVTLPPDRWTAAS